MKTRLALLALIACAGAYAHGGHGVAAPFTQPNVNIVGPGSGTVFYIDAWGKPCGVGMKSSGIYPVAPMTSGNWSGSVTLNGTTTMVVNSTTANGPIGPGHTWVSGANIPAGTAIVSGTPGNTGTFILSQAATGSATETATFQRSIANSTPAWWTFGDSPDADPGSTSVCSTAQWATKYGCATSACNQTGDNAALVSFLNNNFLIGNQIGFANTAKIYYVSTSGDMCSPSCTTAVVNDPAHPYGRLAPILNLLDVTGSSFTASATLANASPILTVTTGGSGTIQKTSKVTGTSIPGNTYIVRQISGTVGGAGSYLMTNLATATVGSPESVTVSSNPGGVIVVRGGTYAVCTSSAPSSSCLSFQPGNGNGGNPNWELSGSPGAPLLVTSFPGEVVNVSAVSGFGSGDIFDLTGAGFNQRARCCLTINGLQMNDPVFDAGGGAIRMFYYSDATIQNNEFAGWDKVEIGHVRNVTFAQNVMHEMYAHTVYNDWATGCWLSSPQVDTNFATEDAGVYAVPSTSCGATYNLRIMNNVAYDTAYGGSDSYHLNGWSDGNIVSGNVTSYGGYPISGQTGVYNAQISGNLNLDVTSECVLLYLYANGYGVATPTNGSTSLPIAAVAIPNNSNFPLNAYIFDAQGAIAGGLGLPNGTDPAAATATQITVSPGNPPQTYTISPAAIGNTVGVVTGGLNNGLPAPSTLRWNSITNNICWEGNPNDVIFGGSPGPGIKLYDKVGFSYIKNTVITGNVIATYDNGGGGTLPFEFQDGSAQSGSYSPQAGAGVFPESGTITSNTFWNNNVGSCSPGSGNCNIMEVDNGASQTIAAGVYTFSGAGQFSSFFAGNSSPTTNPLPGVSESCVQAPGTCSLPASLLLH